MSQHPPPPGKAAARLAASGGGPLMDRGWADVLADVPLFAGVGRRQLARIAESGVLSRFRPGAAMVEEGEEGRTMYVILEGRASVRARGLPPRELGPGDFFGEMALLDDRPRSATVVAESEVLAVRLNREPFLRLLEQEPSIAIAMLRELAARVRELHPAAG